MIRKMSDEDFRAYAGRSPSEVWTGIWTGVTDGQSFGVVLWDADGRAWGFVDVNGQPSPFRLHRAARRVMAALREAGEREVRAFCDDTPKARKWLERLGFKEREGVWICQV